MAFLPCLPSIHQSVGTSAKVLYVKGRTHPVHIKYLEQPTQDYIEAAVKTVFQIHRQLPPGDILVFLAGQDDIESMKSQLDLYIRDIENGKYQILVCPLYARLTPAEQNKAFGVAPPNSRKIILATNVAETSITISGIRYVVDTGMAKEKTYHAATGLDSLLLSPISKSSATQRAGRAGREVRVISHLPYRNLFTRLYRTRGHAFACTLSSTTTDCVKRCLQRFRDAAYRMPCCIFWPLGRKMLGTLRTWTDPLMMRVGALRHSLALASEA